MSRTLRLLWRAVLLVALACGPCHAQDLEVLQDDDFVDPAILNGRWFVATRAYVGYDTDYTRRSEFFAQPVSFARLVNNVFVGGFQFRTDYTRFAANPSAIRETYETGRAEPIGNNMQGLPLSRVGVEASRYLGEDSNVLTRLKFIWSEERLMSGRREHDIGIAMDMKLVGAVCTTEGEFEETDDSGLACTLGAQYLARPAQERHQLSFSMRQTFDAERLTLVMAEGGVVEWTGGAYRGGGYHLQVGTIIRIPPATSRVHVMYSYGSIERPETRLNQLKHNSNEFAVFLSVPLFARVF